MEHHTSSKELHVETNNEHEHHNSSKEIHIKTKNEHHTSSKDIHIETSSTSNIKKRKYGRHTHLLLWTRAEYVKTVKFLT